MKHEESAHQQAWFAAARLHPQIRKAYAIPNGGARNRITAAILKAEGVRKGMLDICLPVAAGSCHGLYIELKSSTGRLSTEQATIANELVADGYMVVVSRDWRKAWDWTLTYLKGDLPPSLILEL